MLIGRRDEVLLSDFGIAAVVHSTTSMSVQMAVGTIPYMAPEQIQEYPRPASDQYALGVVVYEWLCGDFPFRSSFTEIMAKHLMKPPPPLHAKIPTVSLTVEEVVLTALAKDPKGRFATIQAFATALEQACQTTSPRPFALHGPCLDPLFTVLQDTYGMALRFALLKTVRERAPDTWSSDAQIKGGQSTWLWCATAFCK